MEQFQNELNKQKCLLVKIFDSQKLRKVKLFLRPLLILAIFLVLGIVLSIVRDGESQTMGMEIKIALFCAGLWMYIGPLLIYRHFHSVYTKFWLRIYELDDYKDEVVEANASIHTKYRRVERCILGIWLLLIFGALMAGNDKLSVIGIHGLADPLFFYLLAIGILAGYLTSLGFSQSLKMVYSIGYLSNKIVIPIDELNEDGVGNYSVVAKYCFSTTLYLTSGVLFIPILVEFMNSGDDSTNWLTIILIICFSVFTLISMVYPLMRGHVMANEAKGRLLQDLKKQLIDSLDHCVKNPSEEAKIQWETLDFRYKLADSIPTYPFQLGVIMRIAGTTLIPIVTFLLQMFLTQDVILDILNKLF